MTQSNNQQPPAWNWQNISAILGPEGIQTSNQVGLDPKTIQEIKNIVILVIIGIVLSIALFFGLKYATEKQTQ